jgi:hypothetical protein
MNPIFPIATPGVIMMPKVLKNPIDTPNNSAMSIPNGAIKPLPPSFLCFPAPKLPNIKPIAEQRKYYFTVDFSISPLLTFCLKSENIIGYPCVG